jgi:hypothetical protein
VKLAGDVSGIPPDTVRRYMTPGNQAGTGPESLGPRFLRLATRTRARWALSIVARLQGGGLRGRDGLGLQWLLEQHAPDLYNSAPVSSTSPALALVQVLQGSVASAMTRAPGDQGGGPGSKLLTVQVDQDQVTRGTGAEDSLSSSAGVPNSTFINCPGDVWNDSKPGDQEQRQPGPGDQGTDQVKPRDQDKQREKNGTLTATRLPASAVPGEPGSMKS